MNRIIEDFPEEDLKKENRIEGIVDIKVIGSTVHFYLPREAHVKINTVSGLLYKEVEMQAGNHELNLSNGIYFIQISGRTYKVSLE